MNWKELNNEIGNIDLYWLDFILKGYLPENAKILDAGCGEGRNLIYCLKNKLDVFAVDQNAEAIQFLRLIAKQYKLEDIDARIQVMKLDNLRFPDASFDVIVCSAVLHFAKNDDHFTKILDEFGRVLKPKGKIFIRTMTDRFVSSDTHEVGDGIYQFSNEQIRYITKAEEFKKELMKRGFDLIEPYKEVVVEKSHAMGTFMVQKQ